MDGWMERGIERGWREGWREGERGRVGVRGGERDREGWSEGERGVEKGRCVRICVYVCGVGSEGGGWGQRTQRQAGIKY